MLSNFKMPHWAQLLIAALIVAVTWIMAQQASGDLTLPATAVTVLTLLKLALQSVQPTSSGASKGSQSGFARMPLLFVLASVCIVFAFLRPAIQSRHASPELLSRADVVAIQGEGCAFFNHEAPVLKQDAMVDVPCVISVILTSGGSFAACGVTAASQLGPILADLIAYYDTQNSDAGAAGAMPVPYKGIPSYLTPAQLARLKAYAAQVQAAADAGKH